MKRVRDLLLVTLASVAVLSSCGGGGSSSSSSSSRSSTPLSITTASPLPGALQGHSYSVTLAATGGQGAYHWSLGNIDQTHPAELYGLSLNPDTGVISGTPSFDGQFLATVTDSASPPQTASKAFTLKVGLPLSVEASQNLTLIEFDSSRSVSLRLSGGVSPITYSLDRSCLPPGMKAGDGTIASNSVINGTPLASGTFQCLITVQDSFSPPQSGTQLLTMTVLPPPLRLPGTLPSKLLLGRPYSGRFIATGGTPPYSFALASGSLPPGLSAIDPNTGQINGTPTIAGQYSFTIEVTDSAFPAALVEWGSLTTVAAPIGRNDSPATATPIGNGSVQGSISPYIDPPNGTPDPGDNDYYKLISLGGATVHVETYAKRAQSSNPLDTVLEIVDANGRQLSTCRQPGDSSTNFASACLNDDMSSGVQDSSLDYQVPGATDVAATFYVHVLDWRGDARPDMFYSLNVSGSAPPLAIDTSHVLPADRGIIYTGYLLSANGNGTVTWSVDSGSLPPGITLNSGGVFAGAATTNGTYAFTVRATDSANPPHTATGSTSIQVFDPLTFTSPATWPDACQNQPYSFAVQTSGGAPPAHFTFFYSSNWPGLGMGMTPDRMYYDGVFTGTPTIMGTFAGQIYMRDASGTVVSQVVTVSVVTCP